MTTTTLHDLKGVNMNWTEERINKIYESKIEKSIEKHKNFIIKVYGQSQDLKFERENFVFVKNKKQEKRDVERLFGHTRIIDNKRVDFPDITYSPYHNITNLSVYKFEKIKFFDDEVTRKWRRIHVVDIEHQEQNGYKVIELKIELNIDNNGDEPVEFFVQISYDKSDFFTIWSNKIEKGTTNKVRKIVNENVNNYFIKIKKKNFIKGKNVYLFFGYKRPIKYELMKKNLFEEKFDFVNLRYGIEIDVKIQNNIYEKNEIIDIDHHEMGKWYD